MTLYYTRVVQCKILFSLRLLAHTQVAVIKLNIALEKSWEHYLKTVHVLFAYINKLLTIKFPACIL